jgi:hypothetical protein
VRIEKRTQLRLSAVVRWPALLARAEMLLAWLTRARPASTKLRPHHVLALIAALLTAPSLGGGLALDDHVLAYGATRVAGADSEVPGLHVSPLSLFRFTTGRAEDNHALMDQGVLLPWWSDPGHLNAFFRPLSSLSHVLDFRLFAGAPWLMHAHSLLWLNALVLGVAHIYSRIDPAREPGQAMTRAAGLAVLLFAIDDAHGMTAGWLANRNALIAATLALPALGAHHRYLAGGFPAGRVLGPLCFALGLLAGETAVAVFGYVLAYAIVLDRAPIARRVAHILPYVAVLIAWRLAFKQLHLGSAGSGAYHDPGDEPLGFALALAQHLPVLLGSQLSFPVADLYFWGEPALQLVLLVVAGLNALVVLALAHVLLARDPVARFWMIGMVLSSCAVAASVPGERLLLVPSVGGAALLAKLLLALYDGLRRTDGAAPLLPHKLALPMLAALALVHGPVSMASLPVRAGQLVVMDAAIARADAGISREDGVRERDVVVINPPFDVLVSYIQIERIAAGEPHPAHLNWLAVASSELAITRTDEHTLRIAPEHGFLKTAPERHYRGDPTGLPRGSEVELSAFTATVVESTADGRPAVVDFRFREPLGGQGRLTLLKVEHGSLVPFDPPAVGQRAVLPKADFFVTLLAEALGLHPEAPVLEASRRGSH